MSIPMVRELNTTFRDLDLRGKLTTLLVAGALGIGVASTFVAYISARHYLTRHTEELLEAHAQLERREAELRLDALLALAESIAGNTVTANALADSAGRENYLEPLLRNQKLGLSRAGLAITDYRGNLVARNSGIVPVGLSSLFEAMLLSGASEAAVVGTELTVVLPIVYRLTGNIEGSVVLAIPLDELHEQASGDSAASFGLADRTGKIVAGAVPNADDFERTLPLSLSRPLDTVGLSVVVMRDRASALRELDILLASSVMMGFLVIASLILIARAVARFLTEPLLQTVAAAEEIASAGRPVARLTMTTRDEFGRLAAAFNTMVDRLQESYTGLEEHVAARTRDLEASQRQAEKASNLLREAVSSIAQGFTIYDEEDRLVLCNDTYLDFYSQSRDLIVPGARFEEIIRGGALRGQYAGTDDEIEAWVRHRVGQHRNANGEVIEQQLSDGRWLLIVEYRTPSGYIVGNRIDITERHVAEAKIRDRTEQLNAIFALSPDGFVSFDQSRCIKYVSPAFNRMTGFSNDEIVGLPETEFSALLARDCVEGARFPGFDALRKHADQSEESNSAGKRRRVLIEMSSAGKRVLDVGLRVSESETVSQILYIRDVTYESEVDRLKSEFLSTAAHELRTPMASVYGFSEVMLAHDFSVEEQKEFLTAIHSQAELMSSIVNELLDLARIEARRGKDFHFERLETLSLIRSIVTEFKVPNGRTPPAIDEDKGMPALRGDCKKLTQAIGNVVANAYKYSPAGGAVSITLKRRRVEDGIQVGIVISDEGIGMTPTQLERVCERFYRADTSGKIPGTGLGMSIVKEIVELHGGAVEIASTFGKGTSVTLWVPAATERLGGSSSDSVVEVLTS